MPRLRVGRPRVPGYITKATVSRVAGSPTSHAATLSMLAALLDMAGESRLRPGVLEKLATELARALDVPMLSIRLLDRTRRFLDLKASVGLSKALRARIARLPVTSPIGAALVARGRMVSSGDPISTPGPWPSGVLRRFGTAAFVPIRSGSTVLGALGVAWRRGAEAPESQLRFLDALGRQLGAALRVVRARETRRKLRSETRLLRKITAALSSNLEQREILDMVTSAAWRLTRAAGAIVILLSRDRAEFEVANQSHGPRHRPRLKLVGVRFPYAGSLAGRVVRTGRSVRISDTSRDRRPMVRDLVDAVDVRALMMVPLPGARGAIGALAVSSPTPRMFSAHDRRILTQLGQQASIAIQNARLFDTLRDHRQLLRTLYSQQFSTLESERKRIAHELHDEMGPTLSAILINLQLLREDEPSEGTLGPRVLETERLLAGLIDKIRELAYGLHPPMLDNLGLAESVRWMVDTYFTGGRLAIDYRHTGVLEHLNPDVALALYRVAQEALTNVVKHAQAKRVGMRLRSSGSLVALHVQDDGCGFDTGRMQRRSGFGLASMRERTEQLRGRMTIRSAPGKGCCLTVSFPVEVRGARAVG